jgi:hypothetical protein
MPSRIEVLRVDAENGRVRVVLLGPARPPEPRLFVLTDERGRRFVPATADCLPMANDESEQKRWLCSLTIAPLYRRAALTGVAMEWGDREVHALPGQVRSRWAEAQTGEPHPDSSQGLGPTRSNDQDPEAPPPNEAEGKNPNDDGQKGDPAPTGTGPGAGEDDTDEESDLSDASGRQ